MFSPHTVRRSLIACFALELALAASAVAKEPKDHRMVIVPEEDRFTPFALTIRVGDTVEWVNNDTDDHTVVSDDFFNTTGPTQVDQLLPGTDSNGGVPAPPFRIRFQHAGTFVYFCRFHSHLDADHQPTAPGPKGGIQTEKDPTLCDPAGTDTCDFGTPMMGVITVIPGGERDRND